MRKDPTEFRERFKRWKQGLPAYKDGKRYLWDDQTQSWDRITDSDVANAMAEWAFTPTTTRAKFDYENTPNPAKPLQKNAVISQDNNAWTKQRVAEESNKRTWLSDAADAMHKLQIASDIAGTVYGGFEYAPVRNNIIKPLVKSVVRAIPTTDIERRGIEVLLRSTNGNGSGVSPKRLLELSKLYKNNTKSVFNYIFTGNGSKSFTRGLGNTDDYYTGFRRINDYSKPNAIFNDSKYGDVIDALLYKKKINPKYGVVQSEEPLFDFGLTPELTKKYDFVQKYKVLPEENMYGFGETISPSEYKNIKNKHVVTAYDEFGKMTRPTSTSVPTKSRVGADLGHYDMQTGQLNGEPVYRWQDIYEFNPAQYKASWDLSEPGESFITSALKKVFLERLDKAHTPITIQRDWFTRPFGPASREFGFEIQ